MNIVVTGIENNKIDLFAKFIRTKYQNMIAYNALNYDFSNIDKYINTLNIKLMDRPLSTRSIMLASSNLLTIVKMEETFVITIDSNILVPYTNIAYISILKLINYGNMEMKGCFLFTKAKQFIEKNILNYYNNFEGID